MATKKGSKYLLQIDVNQSTDGEIDGHTLVEEFSKDANVHSIKTEVFTRHLTQALAAATTELTSMAIAINSKK